MDDVSNELDNTRWPKLIDFLKREHFQVFITTSNNEFLNNFNNIENVKKFFIKTGKAIPVN